jgi:hypothetical protein
MTVEQKVREWLEGSGFPLEMQAAAAFKSAGFEVRQSSMYVDPETSKGREIDVIAVRPDLNGVINIAWILECKAHSNPWIVLCSNDTYSNFSQLHAFAEMSDRAFSFFAREWDDGAPASQKYFRRPTRGGYGFRQVFAKDNDPAYGAAVTVVKACHDFAHRYEDSAAPFLQIAFPLIVVGSPLFECWLDEHGRLDLREVQASEFLISAHISESVTCAVRIVTQDYLPKFAKEAFDIAECVATDLRTEEDRVMADLRV